MNPYAQPGAAKPKAKPKSFGAPASVGLPPVFRGYVLGGSEPALTSNGLSLTGTLLQQCWYESAADRRSGERPTIAIEFRIVSCERHVRSKLLQMTGVAANTNRLYDRAERYRCVGELVEIVRPDHPYGQWLRMQGTIDEAALDRKMDAEGRMVTRFQFTTLVGTPSQPEVRLMKANVGFDLVMGVRQLLCPEVEGGGSMLNDPQVDRFLELFLLLSWRTRMKNTPPVLSPYEREILVRECDAIDTEETAMMPQLRSDYATLLTLRTRVNELLRTNRDREQALQAAVVPDDARIRAEAALNEIRQRLELDALQARVGTMKEAFKKLKKRTKDPRSPHLRAEAEALKTEEGKLTEAQRQIKPFEDRVRAAPKVNPAAAEALREFQRRRTIDERGAVEAFNHACRSQRPLWTRADKLFLRREEVTSTLAFATVSG